MEFGTWFGVVVAVIGAGMAGCVGTTANPAGTTNALAPAFDESTGSITGLVLTEEIQPIVGAQVGIEGSAIAAVTDDGGRYTLNFVPPGKQTVGVVAMGFKADARQVEVAAGLVVDHVDFTLPALPSLAPFSVTNIFNLKVGGELVKIGLECTYGSQYGVHVPPGLPINDANVKTCQGANACLTPGNTCVGPTEVHYGRCGLEKYGGKDYGCDFDKDWESIFGEVQWTPTTAFTGRGWSWEVLAPNVTRSGATNNPPDPSSGSVDQKDLHDWWQMNSHSPIKTRIDKATALDGSPSGVKGNHPMVPDDLCGGFAPKINPGGCDWAWRLFPGWCTINGLSGGAAGCEKPGPDFVVDADGTPVKVYFTYFMRQPAPEGWSAVPDQ